jgi:transcriptional regulator with XRE-family HTH domain
MSQKELAERLGVVQSAISAWESGEKMPRASQLPDLAKALSCTIDELYAPPEKTA